MIGPLLTSWTIRLALACYLTVLAIQLSDASPKFRRRFARSIWSAGCLLMLLHLACAFHFYHGWSHAHAMQHTADETERLIGWRFGAGVFFNYAFALIWAGDAAWWWLAAKSYSSRPRLLALAIHAYLLFIAINGAIVFETGPTRWVGIGACVVLLLLLWRKVLGTKA